MCSKDGEENTVGSGSGRDGESVRGMTDQRWNSGMESVGGHARSAMGLVLVGPELVPEDWS